MAGDPLKKVQAGDKLEIPAQTFNTMIDAAQDFLRRQRSISQEPPQSFRQASIVLVRNNSGTDRSRGEILGITSPIISPTDNLNEFKKRVALDCGTPSPSQHIARFVVLLEPVAGGKIGRAVIAGVVPAYIYVYDDCHEWADVHPAPTGDEAYHLTSAQYGGAPNLVKESGTGHKRAGVGRFGPDTM